MKVGLIQMSVGPDKAANIKKALELTRDAAKRGAQVVCLQELFATQYFCQVEDQALFDLAEPIPGPSTQPFQALAAELRISIMTSNFERRAPGLYHNTTVVLGEQGQIAGRYRKMHIPDDPQFYEKFYFTPGDLGFVVIDTPYAKLGPLVCWDQWYPEAARLMALAGAEILLYPTAIGWDPRDEQPERERQRDAWRTIQRAHAIANGIPVAACNRVGREPDPSGQSKGIEFWGDSFICGTQGEILAEAAAEPEVLVVEIDRARGEAVRRMWPYLRDRRIDAYGDLTRRFRD